MNKNPLEMARQGGITSLPPGLAHRASERVTKLFDTSLLLLFYFPKTLCDCQFGVYFERESRFPEIVGIIRKREQRKESLERGLACKASHLQLKISAA